MNGIQGLFLGLIIGLMVGRALWIWDDIRKEKDHETSSALKNENRSIE